ncbi:MAG: GAF domain-containing protein [Candidatus Zixiibacteriota bacterium]
MRDQKRRLEEIREYQRQFSAADDPGILCKRIAELTRSFVNSEISSLFIFSKSTGRLERKHTAGFDGRDYSCIAPDEWYRPGKFLTGQACPLDAYTEAKIIESANAERDKHTNKRHDRLYKPGLKSGKVRQFLAIPLVGENRVFGVLRVINKLESVDKEGIPKLSASMFTDNDKELLAEMAHAAAGSYASLMKVKKTDILNELSRRAITDLKIHELCDDTAVKLTGEVYGYRACTIRLHDAHGRLALQSLAIEGKLMPVGVLEETYPGLSAIPISRDSIAGQVALDGHPVIDPDILDGDVPLLHRQFASDQMLRSCYYCPLKISGEVLGTLAVYTGDLLPEDDPGSKIEVEFYENERRSIESLANLLALVVYYGETYSKWGAFFKISGSVQNRSELSRAVSDILIGLTSDEGLSFNRAIMLKLESADGSTGTLSTLWSVGQAQKSDWLMFYRTVSEMTLQRLLEESDRPTILQRFFKETRVKFSVEDPVLSKVLGGDCKPTDYIFDSGMIDAIKSSCLWEYLDRLWSPEEDVQFAVVPMRLEGTPDRVNGFIYVDNKFDNRPIEPKIVDVLSTFADFAASTIRRFESESYMGQVVIDVGHHLLTPMATISQNLRALEKLLSEDDRANRLLGRHHWNLLEASRRNADIGAKMIRRILRLRELEEGGLFVEKSRFSAHALFRDCKSMFPQEESHRLLFSCDDDLHIVSNREFLQLAIFEILENGLKYSGTERVEYSAVEKEGDVIIDICDRGPGISESARTKVFSKYWRDTRSREITRRIGLGLGLHLV